MLTPTSSANAHTYQQRKCSHLPAAQMLTPTSSANAHTYQQRKCSHLPAAQTLTPTSSANAHTYQQRKRSHLPAAQMLTSYHAKKSSVSVAAQNGPLHVSHDAIKPDFTACEHSLYGKYYSYTCHMLNVKISPVSVAEYAGLSMVW